MVKKQQSAACKCLCDAPLEGVKVEIRAAEDTLSIVLPLPHQRLAPNSGRRYPAGWIARLVRERRADCRLATQAAILRQFDGVEVAGFPWPQAEIAMHFVLPRKRDEDNLVAWAKSTIDGIADAGVVANDRHFRMGVVSQQSGKDLRHCMCCCIKRIGGA